MPIRVLKRGCKGSFVAEIQSQLNLLAGYGLSLMGNGSSLYPALVEDGDYGRKTVQRVEEFQKWNPPLKVDGKVGPNTYAKLSGKFWSPLEDAKAAKATPVNVVDAAPARTHGALYLIDGVGVDGSKPEQRASTKQPRASRHPVESCHYVYIDRDKFSSVVPDTKAIASEHNVRFSEVLVIAHGGGAGHLWLGGSCINMNGPNAELFRLIRETLVPGGIIWFFVCNFATRTAQRNQSEADAPTPNELRQGNGSQAMQKIAAHSGCEVRATFMPHFGSFDHFPILWASAKPNGSFEYHLKGRTLSVGELITIYTDAVVGNALTSNAPYLLAVGVKDFLKAD